MEPQPLKRQPRGQEPMKQKVFRVPERVAAWIERGSRRHGITEARFLVDELERVGLVPPSNAEREVA